MISATVASTRIVASLRDAALILAASVSVPALTRRQVRAELRVAEEQTAPDQRAHDEREDDRLTNDLVLMPVSRSLYLSFFWLK